ncbi:MAG: class I SAM-dependent methyltransferase [Acidobacteriaceae bacterium]|nr:class I SAM-dependent methyltransferase [Acidobacteriaceae bacterium]
MVSEREETHYLTELPLPSFVPRRYRPGGQGTWSGHHAFAHDLIIELQPSLIVELGTHLGESYFSFCQSVFEGGLSCLCYAVDTWLGDPHSEFYDERVFQEVAEYNNANYRTFSYLLRSTFDAAVSQFAESTIDLLHIDGLHTYEAVKRDFEQWFPCVNPGGIVMLHDIAARHSDFGVWAFWRELEKEFRDTFAFHHSWGLGVLRKPGGNRECPRLLELLFHSPAPVREALRRHYVLYAAFLDQALGNGSGAGRSRETVLKPAGLAAQPPESESGLRLTTVQVYLCGNEEYSESNSLVENLEIGVEKEIVFEFVPPGSGSLRIDPADCPSLIEIYRLEVADAGSDGVMWSLQEDGASSNVEICGSALRCSGTGSQILKLLSSGTDPQVKLPVLTVENRLIRLRIKLRVDDTTEVVLGALQQIAQDGQKAAKTVQAAVSEADVLRRELSTARAEQMLMAAELRAAIADRNDVQRELKAAEAAVEQARARHAALEAEVAELKATIETERQTLIATNDALAAERRALAAEVKTRDAIFRSVSWRITKPARALMTSFRNLSRGRGPSTP